MDVESTGAASKETLIRPTRARQNRPIDAERYQPDLSAMRVARKDEVDLVVGHRVERQRIVEEQQPKVVLSARESTEERFEVYAAVPVYIVRAHDLDRPDRGLEAGFIVDQQGDADCAHRITNVVGGLMIVIAEDGGTAVRNRLERP